MKRKHRKDDKDKKPPRYTIEQIKKMEQQEKERIFWTTIMNDNLGGKKGHDGG